MTSAQSSPESHEYLGALATQAREFVVTGLGDATTDWARFAGPERHLPICGAMGHAMSVALGLAVARPDVDFLAIEGDGGVVLNLGALITLGQVAPSNLMVLVLNNGCYASSGGQPLSATLGPLDEVARACGVTSATEVSDVPTLLERHAQFLRGEGPSLINLKVARRTVPRFPFGRRPNEIRASFVADLSAHGQSGAE